MGLVKTSAGNHLLGQAIRPVIAGWCEGIGVRAGFFRRRGVDLLSVVQATILHHIAHQAQAVNGIQIVDILTMGMIASFAMIAADTQDVSSAQSGRPQQVGLDGQATSGCECETDRYQLDQYGKLYLLEGFSLSGHQNSWHSSVVNDLSLFHCAFRTLAFGRNSQLLGFHSRLSQIDIGLGEIVANSK